MPARKYADEQIEEALRIYKDEGPAEAARQTGIKKNTITSWAKRKQVQSDAPQNLKAAVEMAKLTREQRQERLTDLMIDEAEAALEDHRKPYTKLVTHKDGKSETFEMRPDPTDRKNLSTSFGILFDKNPASDWWSHRTY